MFEFKLNTQDNQSRARSGVFSTPHLELQTPELAIVATEGEIKAIPKELWPELPCQYLIVNTFHIYTKKILAQIESEKEIHNFMNLSDRTYASDSGGFQVFSLGFGKSHQVGKIGGFFPGAEHAVQDTENPVTITENDVTFRWDGEDITLNPEISMDIQHKIGADIIFAFDECTSPLNSKEYTAQAQQRTFNWLDRCIEAHKPYAAKQALFGIVQGGAYHDLRIQAAEFLAQADVPGYGIGGSLGKTKAEMHAILDWILPILPVAKPRHLLGIGQVRDIFEGVERGVDLFDCVIPTREARHRVLYTHEGRISMRHRKADTSIVSTTCGCFGCREGVTWEQLWQMFVERDPRGMMYTTSHNIWFFSELMAKIRASIQENKFAQLKEEYLAKYPAPASSL
ncbi:MAG: tRNA guanosine(34) transglycosylase Tgt [Weeksellaceae bacterium]